MEENTGWGGLEEKAYLQEIKVELIGTTNFHRWDNNHGAWATLHEFVVEQGGGLQVLFGYLGDVGELLGRGSENLGHSIGVGPTK